MTFREMQQNLRADEDKREQRRKRFEDRIEQRLKDNWEAVNKALYTLMLGHAAGLVACMTLLKDNAASPAPIKGVGTFITLFGLGLSLAVFAAACWTIGRFNFVIFPDWILKVARALGVPFPKRLNIRSEIRDWWTSAFAATSTILIALASLIAVCKFGTL